MTALTKRQRQIAILLSSGLSVSEVAQKLDCTTTNIYFIRSLPHVKTFISQRTRRMSEYNQQLQASAKKKCATCNDEHPVTEFYHNVRTGVTDSYCRKCRQDVNEGFRKKYAAKRAELEAKAKAFVAEELPTPAAPVQEVVNAAQDACDCISVDPAVLRKILTGQREPDDALLASVGLRRVTRIEPIAEEVDA